MHVSDLPPCTFSREISKDVDVQEYLDAIVDEFRTFENESEYDMKENETAEHHALPRISVSKAFDDDMQHYLVGYGENYGQLSASHILPDETRAPQREPIYDDLNSVEVHTSLGSSQSEEQADEHEPVAMQLPVESVFDQVQRFRSSMKQDEVTKVSPTHSGAWIVLLLFPLLSHT
jgi:hypothetical protein